MSAPRWQRLVVAAQREVSVRTRAALDREDVMGALAGVRVATGSVLRAGERPLGALIHLAQLPTTADLRAMHRQVASLEREVRELRKQVADTTPPVQEPYR